MNLDSKRESGDKTESILKCVEYSHSNLSPEAQKLLLCLAPYSGFIYRDGIPNYVKQLQKLEPFKDYAFEKFDAAIQEAINWGLLSTLDEDIPQILRIQPIFPYFLKTKLDTLDEASREALGEGFKNHYQQLANELQKLMEAKDAQERQFGLSLCLLEYENLFNTLQSCLEKQERIYIFFCLFDYFRLGSDIQSALRLSEFVCQAQEAYSSKRHTGEIRYEIVLALERLAYCYLRTRNYQKAKESYQKVVELLQQLTAVEEKEKQLELAVSYHQLGIVAKELREFEQARHNCQQALEICIEFGERYSCARIYHQLGIVAQELRELDKAWRYYRQALAIFIEFGDQYSQANSYHQLATVAQESGQFKQAQRYYQQALEIYIEFGDHYAPAYTYHQLGIVAQRACEFDEARCYYQQALEIFIEFGDHYSQASTYAQLGLLAETQEDYAEARANFQKALEIWIEYKDEYHAAIAREALERLSN